MRRCERKVRQEQTFRCHFILLLVGGLSLFASLPTEAEARPRIFGRRHRAACYAPVVPYRSALTTTTYQCPIYQAGKVGDLYMYYSCQWTPMGCGPNPQPMYLEIQNAQFCPADNPEQNEDDFCVASGSHDRGKGFPDDGCKNGYTGDVPMFDENVFTVVPFTGKYERGVRDFQIRFFKLTHKETELVLRVGFEDANGDFELRPEAEHDTIACCGRKGFDVQVDHTDNALDGNYRVLLRKTGPTMCRMD